MPILDWINNRIAVPDRDSTISNIIPDADGVTALKLDLSNSKFGRTEKIRMSAEAGIRTRVLTLARLSDNQLHYFHSWLPHLLNGFKAFEGIPGHVRVCQMPERQLWYRRRSLRTGSLVTLMPSFLRTDTSCG